MTYQPLHPSGPLVTGGNCKVVTSDLNPGADSPRVGPGWPLSSAPVTTRIPVYPDLLSERHCPTHSASSEDASWGHVLRWSVACTVHASAAAPPQRAWGFHVGHWLSRAHTHRGAALSANSRDTLRDRGQAQGPGRPLCRPPESPVLSPDLDFWTHGLATRLICQREQALHSKGWFLLTWVGSKAQGEIQPRFIFNLTSLLAFFFKGKWIKHSSPFLSPGQKHLEDTLLLLWGSLLGEVLIFTNCNCQN